MGDAGFVEGAGIATLITGAVGAVVFFMRSRLELNAVSQKTTIDEYKDIISRMIAEAEKHDSTIKALRQAVDDLRRQNADWAVRCARMEQRLQYLGDRLTDAGVVLKPWNPDGSAFEVPKLVMKEGE